jgi:D-3-phosphoglycerate dehydrogenase
MEEINESILKELPNLKFISKFGVGVNNINFPDLKKYDIKIGITYGVNKRAVSELTLGFILSLTRNIYFTSNELKSGVWNKNGGEGLGSLTLGIIGFGNIGRDLLELIKPFKPKVLINDIKKLSLPNTNLDIKLVSKNVLYENSDIITIHTPLTEKTKNLINSEVFKKMKKGSFLINTSRGGIINENDLNKAIENNLISGAALDVYDIEPPENSSLILDKRVITTPHIAGNSKEVVLSMGRAAIKKIIDFKNQYEI